MLVVVIVLVVEVASRSRSSLDKLVELHLLLLLLGVVTVVVVVIGGRATAVGHGLKIVSAGKDSVDVVESLNAGEDFLDILVELSLVVNGLRRAGSVGKGLSSRVLSLVGIAGGKEDVILIGQIKIVLTLVECGSLGILLRVL